jgi:hypothetical protein
MLYFVKVTQSNKGIVLATKPIGKKTVTDSKGRTFRVSSGEQDVKFGFVGMEDPTQYGFTENEALDFELSTENVVTREGKTLEKLFWANFKKA